MERVRGLGVLHGYLQGALTSAVDTTDLLRAELVLGVSALDYYVHEVTRLGIQESHVGQRTRTDAFSRFNVSMASVYEGLADPTQTGWLDDAVRERLGWQSFQHPDKIADALRLVTEVRLWDAVATRLGVAADSVKQTLALIVDRRNKIAHEADADPSYPGARWPIDPTMVNNALGFLDSVAEAINAVI
jgi:hypothetical protein